MAKRQICLVESWEGGLLSPVFSTANYNNYTVARNVIPVYEGLRDDPVYYLNAICIPLQLLTPPSLPPFCPLLHFHKIWPATRKHEVVLN